MKALSTFASVCWPRECHSCGGPKTVEVFVGRSAEKGQLNEAVEAGASVVAVVGLMGYGKSSLLGGWLREKTLPAQTGLFWRGICGNGVGFQFFIDDLYAYLAGEAMDRMRYPKVKDRLALVFSLLKTRPTWVVLDGVERWLRLWACVDKEADGPGATVQDREGVQEGLDDFLRGFSTQAGDSKLFLTTRALPSALDETQVYLVGSADEGESIMNRRLKALSAEDGVTLLRHFCPDAEEALLATIGQTYGYYPYALALVGMLIAADPAGIEFWQQPSLAAGTKLDGLLAKLCGKLADDVPVLEMTACSIGAASVEMLAELLEQDAEELAGRLERLNLWQLVQYDGRNTADEHSVVRRYFLGRMGSEEVRSRQARMGRWWMARPILDWPRTVAHLQPRLKALEYAIATEDAAWTTEILFSQISEKCHYESLGKWLRIYGHLDESVNFYMRAVQLLAKQSKTDPRLRNGLAGVYNNRGLAYRALGQLQEAVPDYSEALNIRRKLVEVEGHRELRNELATVYNNRGVAYGALGRLKEALPDYSEALRIRRELVEVEGQHELRNDLARVYYNRGNIYGALGQLREAVADYDEVLRLRRELVEKDGRRELWEELAAVYNNRALAYKTLGRLPEAIEDYSEVLRIRRHLVEKQGRRELREELATVYNHRGNAYGALGQMQEAVADFTEVLKIWLGLVEAQGHLELRNEVATVFTHRGNAYRDMGQLKEAVTDFTEALKIRRELVEVEGRRELRNDLARIYNSRGLAYRALGQLREAVTDYTQALKLRHELVEKEGRRELRNDLASVYNNRGNAYGALELQQDAVADYSEVVRIRQELVEKEGRHELQNDLAKTLGNRAMTYRKMQLWRKAKDDYVAAMELLKEKVQQGDGHAIDLLAFYLSWGCEWMGQMGAGRETAGSATLAMEAIEHRYRQEKLQGGHIAGFLEAVMRYRKKLCEYGMKINPKNIDTMLRFLRGQ